TLAAAIFLLSQTWLKSIKKTKSQLSTIEMNILAVKRAQEDIIKFETDIKTVEETLGQINEKLPSEKELPELLSKLADLASIFPGKDYISLTPGQTDDLGQYFKLPLVINLKCSYTDLLNYLQKLENLPRLVKLETIQISPAADNPAFLMVHLELNVYYRKSEEKKS
ncbi:MAG: type 4a pilus biogenesis protein PilO, partial [bacterium]